MASRGQDLRGFFSHWVLGIALMAVGFGGTFAMMYLFMIAEWAGSWEEISGARKGIIAILSLAPLAVSFAGLHRIRTSHREEKH